MLEELTGQARQDGLRPLAAGVALPGIVDERAGRIVFSSNVGWRDLPLGERLTDHAGIPVSVTHDVRAGGLAESVLGAGRGVRDQLFLPIGTGIAGAMILDGRPYAAGGFAGEIGHLQIDPAGPACGCGGRGCLEMYASASAISRRYGERRPAGEGVSAAQVAERAAAGEPLATEIWQEAVAALATALHAYVTICAPELIVVGGGLAESGETLLDPLRKALSARLTFHRRPTVVRAALGDRAGLLGAGLVAWGAIG